MINPGDKVIVEGPTFLATIQCFRLYGAEVISAPIDAEGAQADALEQLIAEHRPKLVYLIPTFGNPSGAKAGAWNAAKRHHRPGPGAQGMSVGDDAEHGGGHADADALQARVMELEIKASSRRLLEQLNLTIYRQQQIDRFFDELRDLRRRVPEGGPAGGATHLRDELPPHY
ncbi:Kynurenine/alpha-aminoadipate aminotransferase, mitochondrial [Manis javanica]|nr:Kynurenine/alpha-aminoadipate aminotransferase, mitochondrial [Manis javanica]